MNTADETGLTRRLRRFATWARKRMRKLQRTGEQAVPITLHFFLHTDGRVYQHWPDEEWPRVRRVSNEHMIQAVYADFARLRGLYRKYNKD